MIVDTSAWIEYLRRTEGPYDLRLDRAVEAGEPIATPAPVVMELLSGCGSEDEAARLAGLLGRFEILYPDGLADYEDAALIQRICRRGGQTVRSLVDCLVAAIALREGRPVLARDKDFDLIAEHVALELVSP